MRKQEFAEIENLLVSLRFYFTLIGDSSVSLPCTTFFFESWRFIDYLTSLQSTFRMHYGIASKERLQKESSLLRA
jgi:hypothetical protein